MVSWYFSWYSIVRHFYGIVTTLEQMRLGHASIKQRCEIQCEALAFSDEHKWLCDSN